MVLMLFGMDTSVVLLIMMIVAGNRLIGFISIELIFVVVLFGIWLSSSTYERGRALSYL